MTLRLMHFSDLHFTTLDWGWKTFTSKRWLGQLNYWLFRKNQYQTDHLAELPNFAKGWDADFVIASGDFTSTAHPKEFEHAHRFISTFKPPVLTLPGNHDLYTTDSEKDQTFYHYFPCEDLQKHRMSMRHLKENWWWIGLDCARANHLLDSNGIFLHNMQDRLLSLLDSLPEEASIILGNHFPLFPSGRPRHDTAQADLLRAIIQRDRRIKLYLHGHDHAPYIIKSKINDLLTLNAGSVAHHPGGYFMLIELGPNRCHYKRYKSHDQGDWLLDCDQSHSFQF
jgi:3',5'-cyclic AMP phosphodiesterase CpdA